MPALALAALLACLGRAQAQPAGSNAKYDALLEAAKSWARYESALPTAAVAALQEAARREGVSETRQRADVAAIFALAGRAKQRCRAQRPVDLRDRLPPVRDQGDIGWCYAYVAADLLGYAAGKPLSANDVTVAYNQSPEKIMVSYEAFRKKAAAGKPEPPEMRHTTRVAGTFFGAVMEAAKRGVCTEADFPSDNSQRSSATGSTRVEDLKRMERASAEIHERLLRHGDIFAHVSLFAAFDTPRALKSDPRLCQERHANSFKDAHADSPRTVAVNDVCARDYESARRLMPSLSRADFFRSLYVSSSLKIVERMSEHGCKERVRFDPPPKLKLVVALPWNEDEGYEAAHRALDAPKPVGFGVVDSAFLSDPAGKGGGGHAVSLVGRRWNEEDGRCEFLVRNSWGPACGVLYSPSYPCESGHLWIPARILMKTDPIVAYIE